MLRGSCLCAERKAAGTIKTYSDGVTAFLRWCESTGTPPTMSKTTAQAFAAALLDRGADAATVHARLKGLRRFSAWPDWSRRTLDTDHELGPPPVRSVAGR